MAKQPTGPRHAEVTGLSSCGIVVVDAEPWNMRGPTECREFGIAYIPPIQSFHGDDICLPQTLVSYQQHYGFQSRCCHIWGREREKSGQAFAFGEVDVVDAELVEERLLRVMKSFNNTSSKPVLVGFDLSFELQVIAAHYPRLTGLFLSWVDVQELAAGASGRHPTKMPSLRDTLIALGFGDDPRAVCAHRNWRHCAGNNVVRLAAGLIELLRRPESCPPPEIGQSQKKSSKQKRHDTPSLTQKQWRARPRPYDFYPFVARIYETSEHQALRRFSLYRFFDYFSGYSPTAAGINPSKKYGWVCLPTHEELMTFVRHFDGTQESEEGYIWKAVADPTDSTTSAATSTTPKKNRVHERDFSHSDGEIGDISDMFRGMELFLEVDSTM
ncbi:hypothetical protein INS49_011913 [Diaporthe citri]|uniref:uncharacterized protein n=1 Tax=Diaporthe citri TaxID=83186 RepID=UPI001C824DE0|nr:uncharacterized protein INS49_011913 [Diaporthe citri]KAG6360846.1 hypothetical protein INS49_011913 [Diaporthe citri]